MTYEPDFIASANYYRNYLDRSSAEVFQNTINDYYGKEDLQKMVLDKYIILNHFYDILFPLIMCLYLFKTEIARQMIKNGIVKLCLCNVMHAKFTNGCRNTL